MTFWRAIWAMASAVSRSDYGILIRMPRDGALDIGITVHSVRYDDVVSHTDGISAIGGKMLTGYVGRRIGKQEANRTSNLPRLTPAS